MKYVVNKRTKEHRVFTNTSEIPHGRWEFVKADDDGWVKWRGKKCPLPDGSRYQTKHESGCVIDGYHPEVLEEHWAGRLDAIVKYRPIFDEPKASEDCVAVKYDLDTASVEGAIRDKLIEMGWTPPKDKPQALEWDDDGLPPVGVKIEIRGAPTGSICPGVIDYIDENHCIWHWVGRKETFHARVAVMEFRPICTDREKRIEAAIKAHARKVDAIYDALKSGDLPQP